MNCLYCGKRLSLLRKLAAGEFCSDEHREQYMQDQESLGLARLIEEKQHERLSDSRRKKKPASRAVSSPAPVAERFFPEKPRFQSGGAPVLAPGDPLNADSRPALPVVEPGLPQCGVPVCGVRTQTFAGGVFESVPPTPQAPAPSFVPAVKFPIIGLAQPGSAEVPAAGSIAFEPVFPAMSPCPKPVSQDPEPLPAKKFEVAAPIGSGSELPGQHPDIVSSPVFSDVRKAEGPVDATPVPLPFSPDISAAELVQPVEGAAADSAFGRPQQVPAGFCPVAISPFSSDVGTADLTSSTVEAPTRNLTFRCAANDPKAPELSSAALVGIPFEIVTGAEGRHETETVPVPGEAGMAIGRSRSRLASTGLTQSPPMPLAFSTADAGQPPASPEPEAVKSKSFLVPPRGRFSVDVPVLSEVVLPATLEVSGPVESSEPRRMGEVPAPLSLPVDGPVSPPPAPEPENGTEWPQPIIQLHKALQVVSEGPAEIVPETVSITSAEVPTLGVGGTFQTPLDDFIPHPASSLPLSGPVSSGLDLILPQEGGGLISGKSEFMPPASGLRIPQSGLTPVRDATPTVESQPSSGNNWRTLANPVVARWRELPAGLRWSLMAAPLAAALLVHTANRSPSFTAEAASPGVGEQFASRLQVVRENIGNRAAVALSDDFRSGLGSWRGEGNWADSWSYDDAKLLHPGELALYLPSLGLSDYQMEFAGQIDQGGISWVYRASDTRNYYASRLQYVEQGSMPKAVLLRYAVIDGKAEKPERVEVPFRLRSTQTHQFRVEVRGDGFTTYVNDKVVDFFRDGRLEQGGIGFFSAKGERARLHWVTVTHQYDFLGRLCALVAPYGLGDSPRSVTQ